MRNTTVCSERRREPDLTEMAADPLVQMVLARDGLSHDDFWSAVSTARARLGQRDADTQRFCSAA